MCEVELLRNAREVFRDNLNLYVGAKRRFTVEAISAAIGIGHDAIRRHLRGETTPDLPNLLAYMAVLPPAFASAVLAPAGLGGVHRMDEEAEPTGAHVLSQMLRSGAELARALEDGRIDHREAASLAPQFEEIGIECIGFARSLKTAKAGASLKVVG